MKNDNKFYVLWGLCFFGLVVSMALLLYGVITDNIVMIAIGLIGVIILLPVSVGLAIWSVSMIKKELEQSARQVAQLKEELTQYASFSKVCDTNKHTSYEILSIKNLTPQFAGSFTIEKVMLTPMSYNPEKYIYTSATVGGITTGGIDKIGGNYVSGKKVDSGKCELKYFGQKIQRIQLSDKLYKEAQKTAINKYL